MTGTQDLIEALEAALNWIDNDDCAQMGPAEDAAHTRVIRRIEKALSRARSAQPSSLADVVEGARRDIARSSTDFLGRMNACLLDFENICDEYPAGAWPQDAVADADEALLGLTALALAQLAIVRGEESHFSMRGDAASA